MSFSSGGPSEGKDTILFVLVRGRTVDTIPIQGDMSWGQMAPVLTDNL
jgi:hypothetical protein